MGICINNGMTNSSVTWPGLFKLEGDDELIYVDSLQALRAECEELIFSEDDFLIDSVGVSYSVRVVSTNVILTQANRVFSAHEVSDLIRAHEFTKAELCLTKIHFVQVSEAIKSLAH